MRNSSSPWRLNITTMFKWVIQLHMISYLMELEVGQGIHEMKDVSECLQDT
jgi:hypothetical protein